jgi:hypothetical protein
MSGDDDLDVSFGEYDTVSLRYQKALKVSGDKVAAAILVLADSIERTGYPLRTMAEEIGQLDIKVNGQIDTSSGH